MNPPTRDLVATLRERGLVHQVTDEALGPLSAKEPLVIYIGFDPTASSLHAGSLFPVMLLAHAARAGHRPLALIGGGTGLIGDPGGRDTERPLMDADEARGHAESMRRQIDRLLRSAGVEPVIADNSEWLSSVRFVDFLRDVGKHFTVNWMMAKDSVRTRLEDREQGISFTEFSYMLLQAYDFYRLWKDRGCRVQMGASDQWGNITAGIELIRRKESGEAFGLTCPLLLTSDGKKFGKSAGNAVWLDSAATSPWKFHQFWMHQDDVTAASLLGAFTFLPMDEVRALREQALAAPERRLTQSRLATEVTTFVHGRDVAERMDAAARLLFRGEGSLRDLDPATLEEVFADVPHVDLPRGASEVERRLGNLFTHPATRLAPSQSAFRQLLAQGALSINGEKVPPPADRNAQPLIEDSHFIGDRIAVLRKGKKDYALVRRVQRGEDSAAGA